MEKIILVSFNRPRLIVTSTIRQDLFQFGAQVPSKRAQRQRTRKVLVIQQIALLVHSWLMTQLNFFSEPTSSSTSLRAPNQMSRRLEAATKYTYQPPIFFLFYPYIDFSTSTHIHKTPEDGPYVIGERACLLRTLQLLSAGKLQPQQPLERRKTPF